MADLDVGIEVVAELGEAVLDAAEEAVERGEVGQPRALHQRLQPLAQHSRQVLAQQLPLHRVDQLPSDNHHIIQADAQLGPKFTYGIIILYFSGYLYLSH
jgi:hypothetical protein